jgi:hypothetical protein
MPSLSVPRPEVKARQYRLVSVPIAGDGPVFVEYTQDGESTEYRILEYPGADFGRGFSVVKVSGEDCFRSYDVNIDRLVSTCECWGHLRWSQRGDCRHIWLLKQMMKDNIIRPRPRPIPFPQPPRPAACCEAGSCPACTDAAEDRRHRLADHLDDL